MVGLVLLALAACRREHDCLWQVPFVGRQSSTSVRFHVDTTRFLDRRNLVFGPKEASGHGLRT
jgi:hypothetical protein